MWVDKGNLVEIYSFSTVCRRRLAEGKNPCFYTVIVKLKKPLPAGPIGVTNFNSDDLLEVFSSVILEYKYYRSVLDCRLNAMFDKRNHKLKILWPF